MERTYVELDFPLDELPEETLRKWKEGNLSLIDTLAENLGVNCAKVGFKLENHPMPEETSQ